MITALLLAAVTAAANKPLPPGELCVDGTPCVATTGSKAPVAAAKEPRRFVWTSDARDMVSFGAVPAEASEIALDAGTSRTLRLQIEKKLTVEFAIASPGGKWQWSLKNPPPSVRLLHPSCESCVLAVKAKGFYPFEKPLRSTAAVVLQALPHLRGRVIDRLTGEPLVSATISSNGALLGKTEADGTFDFAVEQWPGARQGIDVAWPGRAVRRLALSPIPGDSDLGTVALSTGGTIRMTVDPPIPHELTWELRDQASRGLLREGILPAAAAEVTVESVGEGTVEFVLRGERPLQQYAVPLEITGDRTVEGTVSIEPATLSIEVTHGAKACAGGTLQVSASTWTWRGDVHLDDEGKATEELWQRGKVFALLMQQGTSTYATGSHVIDSDESTWQIAIPDATLTGRVLDAATGDPIPNARIGLRYRTSSDRGGLRSVRSDAEGRYVFETVDPGTHTLTVHHPAYPSLQDVPVTIAGATGAYEQDLRMGAKSDARRLVVTNEHGAPVSQAMVLVGNDEGVSRLSTGLDGTCPLPLHSDERALVFVIPRTGSFAYLRVGPQRGDDTTVPMRVRGGTATIAVEARDGDGNPLANVYLIARFNGQMLPPDVTDALRMMQGLSFTTDANGRVRLPGMPRGVYELWAATGRDQVAAIRSAAPPPPAAALEVIDGLYNVAIDFCATGGE